MLLLSVMNFSNVSVQGVLRAEDNLTVGTMKLFGSLVNLDKTG
jgi:hypothetical protein